jgi:hypothetical protein
MKDPKPFKLQVLTADPGGIPVDLDAHLAATGRGEKVRDYALFRDFHDISGLGQIPVLDTIRLQTALTPDEMRRLLDFLGIHGKHRASPVPKYVSAAIESLTTRQRRSACAGEVVVKTRHLAALLKWITAQLEKGGLCQP